MCSGTGAEIRQQARSERALCKSCCAQPLSLYGEHSSVLQYFFSVELLLNCVSSCHFCSCRVRGVLHGPATSQTKPFSSGEKQPRPRGFPNVCGATQESFGGIQQSSNQLLVPANCIEQWWAFLRPNHIDIAKPIWVHAVVHVHAHHDSHS
jgi:hypothetical protein